MQVYFSHSYRDPIVNSHFLRQFDAEELPLVADQKTDIWCVAKLERYTRENTGFISIIPRRPTEKDAGAYSAYIGQELSLARRARLPRLLFVDENILKHHRLQFPEDAVPFSVDAPDKHHERQFRAIRDFKTRLDTFYRPALSHQPNTATVVVGAGKGFRKVGEDIGELLRRHGYAATVTAEQRSGEGLEDVRMLEALWRSELAVFLLGGRLSGAHIALAMAHAHCIPSIRLIFDPKAVNCDPSISGAIRWSAEDPLLIEFERQLTSYCEGFVSPYATTMRDLGTMKWRHKQENLWDMQDGRTLINHIYPEHGFVTDEIVRARREFQKSLAQARTREDSEAICRILYEGLRRHRYGYENEAVSKEHQVIRTPTQIAAHKAATCYEGFCQR